MNNQPFFSKARIINRLNRADSRGLLVSEQFMNDLAFYLGVEYDEEQQTITYLYAGNLASLTRINQRLAYADRSIAFTRSTKHIINKLIG